MASQLERIGNILAYMCNKGAVKRYEIRNRAGRIGSPSVFYDSVRRLEALGLIKATKSESKSKAQDAHLQYEITQRGFVLYLRICAQFGRTRLKSQVAFSNLAKHYPEFFPRVFPLWKELETQKVANIAENLLIRLALSAYLDELLPNNLLKHYERRRPPFSTTEPDPFVYVIENSFFDLQDMAYLLMKWRDRARWHEALKSSSKLNKPFVESARAKLRFARQNAELDKLRLRMLKNDPEIDRLIEQFEKSMKEAKRPAP